MDESKRYNRRIKTNHIFIVEMKDLSNLLISIGHRTHISTVSIKYSATCMSPTQVVFAVVVPMTFYQVREVMDDLKMVQADLTVTTI